MKQLIYEPTMGFNEFILVLGMIAIKSINIENRYNTDQQILELFHKIMQLTSNDIKTVNKSPLFSLNIE